jgi:hypothetical protein
MTAKEKEQFKQRLKRECVLMVASRIKNPIEAQKMIQRLFKIINE